MTKKGDKFCRFCGKPINSNRRFCGKPINSNPEEKENTNRGGKGVNKKKKTKKKNKTFQEELDSLPQ